MGPDEKRKPRSVKMSDAEWEEIQKRAAKLGITASEYIRLRTLVPGTMPRPNHPLNMLPSLHHMYPSKIVRLLL